MKDILNAEDYKEVTYEAVEDYNKKDYNLALEKFQKLAEKNYENPKVHEVLSFTYLKLNRIPEAEKEFQICLNLILENNPSLKIPQRKSFDVLVKEAGNLKQVEKEYKKIMESKEVDIFKAAETPYRLGILYMSKGDYQKAADILAEFRDKFLLTDNNQSAA